MREDTFRKHTALLSHSFVWQGEQNKGREPYSSCLVFFHFFHDLSTFAVLRSYPWGPNHHPQNVSLSPNVFFSAWSLEGNGHLVPSFLPGHSQRVTVIQYALALPWAFLSWASLKQASLVSALDARMEPRGLSQLIHSLLHVGCCFQLCSFESSQMNQGLKRKQLEVDTAPSQGSKPWMCKKSIFK